MIGYTGYNYKLKFIVFLFICIVEGQPWSSKFLKFPITIAMY